ncbi:hypothetical protein BpHYR1_039343 [Brachionus plicatilis]|uniref:Uncharacterized protein n=1 Tax=Brachionus plicatilis TaxID=10195 RepID=A0A3M7SUD4_BRAPC|nr:hypothetical protein BpHYR1_039343 [Brachionus plicatilis]
MNFLLIKRLMGILKFRIKKITSKSNKSLNSRLSKVVWNNAVVRIFLQLSLVKLTTLMNFLRDKQLKVKYEQLFDRRTFKGTIWSRQRWKEIIEFVLRAFLLVYSIAIINLIYITLNTRSTNESK